MAGHDGCVGWRHGRSHTRRSAYVPIRGAGLGAEQVPGCQTLSTAGRGVLGGCVTGRGGGLRVLLLRRLTAGRVWGGCAAVVRVEWRL